jgi:hypothetical protein
VQSLDKMSKNPIALDTAVAAGSFLHVAEGFLSHLDSSEKTMLEDMKGTMDYLSENCKVAFIRDILHPQVILEEGKIVIRLPQPENYAANAPSTLGLSALYFNTGVNENQSKGHLFKKYDILQAAINADSMNKLYAYGEKLNQDHSFHPSLDMYAAKMALDTHYGSGKDKSRAAKDMQGYKLRVDFVKACAGMVSIKCKSGKDRTGIAVVNLLKAAVTHKLRLAAAEADFQPLGKEQAEKLKREIEGGISHHITGLNTAKGDAYAFNAFQSTFLPEEMTPERRLCASRAS